MRIAERLSTLLIGVASILVPRSQRASWKEEWRAELWHGLRGEQGARLSPVSLVLRCLGAFPHAVWTRTEEWQFDGTWLDVRYAWRTLLRRPGFAIVATLTLALGIGGDTAVFSIVHSVLLEPLPIENADRLLHTWGRNFPSGPGASVSPPDFQDYRDGTLSVFEEFAAQSSFMRTVVLDAGAEPQEVAGRSFTSNFLAALGHQPAAGRTFTADETRVGGPPVVMISYGLWDRMFGRDPGAVGTTITLDGEAHVVIGVLPADLNYPAGLDIWFPLPFGGPGFDSRAAHFLRPLALLREGVSPTVAQSAMDAVSARLEASYPETNEGWFAVLQPLREVRVGSVRPALMVLVSAVGLVLLIACANVASLLLARSSARRGEIAVRAAMGASRFRLGRQVLVESIVLAVAGGTAGVLLAHAGIAALRAFDPGTLPRIDEVAIDPATLAFTAGLTILVGLLFGLAPALSLRTRELRDSVASAGRGRTAAGGRMRNVLVAGEVGLSFVLLVGAGLLLRSFLELRKVDPGFDFESAVTLPVSLTERAWPDLDAVDAAREAIHAGLEAVPGVTAVGAASVLPMSGSGGDTYVYAEHRPPENPRNVDNVAELRFVDDDYFPAMGIPLIAGRSFNARDDRTAPDRVILNERLARELFPDEDPIGQRMIAWLDDNEAFEVIGVAANVRQYGLAVPSQREFYLSARQRGIRSLTFVVRTRPGTMPPPAALRAAVRRVDPGQPVSRINTLESFIDYNVATDRFQALLVGAFAVLAAALAAIGIYGVLAHSVGQRRREIGIRMAMGAERSSVARMVVGQGLRVAMIGTAIGSAGAIVASHALQSLLFGVGAVDPVTWVAAPLFLLAVVVLSSWLPARNAARTDPATVLREEA